MGKSRFVLPELRNSLEELHVALQARWHPVEVLREEYLAPLNMTAHALAMALHVPAPRINEIVRKARAITLDTALRPARFFNSTAEFWMNLQSAYDLRKAELESAVHIRREVRPLKEAA